MDIINGFVCFDCTDASLATRGIDPARPADGPYGLLKEMGDTGAVSQATRPAASLGHEGALVDLFV